MLQRIQSVFLLLASAAMLIASVSPLAIYLYNTDSAVFEAMGVYLNGQLNDSTWGLFAVGAVSSVLALMTIFLFKKRMLQIRISIFNAILMVGFYLYFGLIVYLLSSDKGLVFQKVGIGVIMPAIALIFTILAIRRISVDEAMVRSLNRLRK